MPKSVVLVVCRAHTHTWGEHKGLGVWGGVPPGCACPAEPGVHRLRYHGSGAAVLAWPRGGACPGAGAGLRPGTPLTPYVSRILDRAWHPSVVPRLALHIVFGGCSPLSRALSCAVYSATSSTLLARCLEPKYSEILPEFLWVFRFFGRFPLVFGLVSYPPGPILESAFLWLCFYRQKPPCTTSSKNVLCGVA